MIIDIRSKLSSFKRFLLLIIVVASAYSSQAENRFFEERYRGWLWFEEKERPVDIKDKADTQQAAPTMEEMKKAKRENEQFKEELELLRHVMIRYPENLEHVRRYKEKEKIMLDNALKLTRSFVMTNFLNPDLADQLENPQNIYGRKALKENQEQANTATLKSVAKKVELFLFFQGACNHCEVLERHLARFAQKYGFKVEAVSLDGSQSKFFKTHVSKELIEQLALKQMPTVIAVTNDSKLRFELARGAVSVPELEDSSLLVAKYLEQKRQLETEQEKSLQDALKKRKN
jgi:thiol-disulfide isomerase/thioredoxin